MLEEVNIKELDAKGMRFGIIASKFNAAYVDSMAEAALDVLKKKRCRGNGSVSCAGSL